MRRCQLPWRNRVLGSPKAADLGGLLAMGTVSGLFATDGSDLVKVVAQGPKAPST